MPAHPGLAFEDLLTLLRRTSQYRDDRHKSAAIDMLIAHNDGAAPWLRQNEHPDFLKRCILGNLRDGYVIKWDSAWRATKEPAKCPFAASYSEIMYLRTASIIGQGWLGLDDVDTFNRQLIVQAVADAAGDRSAQIAVVRSFPGKRA